MATDYKRSYVLNPITLGMHKEATFEPQRTNHFEAYLELPTAIIDADEGGEGKRLDWQKWITLATTDFSLPNVTFSPISIPYGNTKINIAGQVEYGGADSLTCTDFIGADIEGILYRWQNLIYNAETGQMGWAYNYKTNGKVLEYSADGSCISSWILLGVWPSGINYGSSMSRGDSQVKSVSVTITYDLAYRKYGNDTNRPTTPNDAKIRAEEAAAAMRWKDHDKYPGFNSGGPLNLDNKEGSFVEPNI